MVKRIRSKGKKKERRELRREPWTTAPPSFSMRMTEVPKKGRKAD